jgi:hypothetical protein
MVYDCSDAKNLSASDFGAASPKGLQPVRGELPLIKNWLTFQDMRERESKGVVCNCQFDSHETSMLDTINSATVKIPDIIQRPVYYLKLNSPQLYRFVRTSQETLYVSATSPTG